MTAGRDEGELYDLEADANELCNLYHDPEHQHTVNQCRRLLLEWLIRTTRVRTVHPAVKTDVTAKREERFKLGGSAGRHEYPLASDGTAPNSIQPRFAANTPNENYI